MPSKYTDIDNVKLPGNTVYETCLYNALLHFMNIHNTL